MRTVLCVVLAMALSAEIASAAETCGLTSNFLQDDIEKVPDPNNKKKKIDKVFKRKVLFDNSVFIFSETMKVNTDGTLRSYSPRDLTGMLCKPKNGVEFTEAQARQKGCAMNSVCNGVNVYVGDDELDCEDALPKIRAIQANNWKSTGGAKIEWIGIAPKTAKIGSPPCVENGFFVSTASTLSGLEGGTCEQKRYLDALVPSIVVPRCWTRTYRAKHPETCAKYLPAGIAPDLEPGNLVVVRTREATPRPFFAVIGDTGPHRKLGEASVGLLMEVHGKPAPRWLYETYGLSDRVQFDVIIFRGDRYTQPLTKENEGDMKAAARDRFRRWANDDQAKAEERLAACGKVAAP